MQYAQQVVYPGGTRFSDHTIICMYKIRLIDFGSYNNLTLGKKGLPALPTRLIYYHSMKTSTRLDYNLSC
jgi:hypothetical protein